MPDFEFDKYLPGISVDCVIFGFHENELKVLILKMKNWERWILPGGFVHKDMGIDESAREVLEQRTGLKNIFLKQFYFFGGLERNEEGHASKLVERGIISKDAGQWFNQRFLSLGYYALVEFSKVETPQPDFASASCDWWAINDLPDLVLDHREIIEKAYRTLKKELDNEPIGLNLLPQQFTMSELQALYETILDKKLDRRNFRRKILGWDILLHTDLRRTGGSHKAPSLYEFDRRKYDRAIREGLSSGW